MTAPGKVWRVEPNNELRGVVLDYVVMAGDFVIGLFASERMARAVVEAHNATGEAEPIAWQWRNKLGPGTWTCIAEKRPEPHPQYEERPLFAAPPSQIAKVREYRDKYIARAAPEVSTFAVAADEIIKLLEGGE